MATTYEKLIAQYRAEKDPVKRKILRDKAVEEKHRLDRLKQQTPPVTPAAPVATSPSSLPATPGLRGNRYNHRFGFGWLGGARYPSTITKYHKAGWGSSHFSYVDGFGDGLVAAELAIKRGAPWVVIPLMWKDGHDYKSSDIPFVKREATRLKSLILKYPKVKFFVPPVCEHELDGAGWVPFADAVEAILRGLPNYEIVNSPNGNNRYVNAKYINEFHGANKKPVPGVRFAFNFDGTNAVDSDIEEYKKNFAGAVYFIIWCGQCNGNRVVGSTDPKDKVVRKNRTYWPTGPEQIDSWAHLANDRGVIQEGPEGWVYKSHSDQHSPVIGKLSKDQKPVWISPANVKVSFIELRASNGKVVDRAKYYSTFNDKKTGKVLGHRYYHNNWGYKLAQAAIKLSGSPVVDVFVNGKKIGSIEPGFRAWGFR